MSESVTRKTNKEFSRRSPTRKLGWTDAGAGAAGYGIFKRDERARSVPLTRGRGEAGAGAGLWCGNGRKSVVGEGWGYGKEISRGKAKQTPIVACGACEVDGQG